ncbi:membrane-associated protein [Adhaeribacter sp. BT258]|uniref:Membrane-associated protein n=1 Tax=Adhaeribacter terrigena TaxID=2793070 RepID=A0ABS1C280_9BACT|nr:membrane-associated protein [Adhaeribacter terrigena]MBK0402753.1 membrane-associated protein [Adhaeribacter terrigena]
MNLWLPALPDATLIPLWIKIAYTVFVAVLVPVYWKKWGLANFLWFSDVALFVMLAAVWLESSLLASMMGVAVLIPEIAWNVSYFVQLLTGKRLFSLTDYMFDSTKSRFLRALSLFHVVLPPLILWMIWKTGFHESAFWYQVLFGWAVLLFTFLFTSPAENINMVFGPGAKPQTRLSPKRYLLLVMLGLAIGIYLPAYLILQLVF